MKSKDTRLISTAVLSEENLDERSMMERLLDGIGDVADDNGWMWVPLDEDDEYSFQLQKDRYTIYVKVDQSTAMVEASKLEVAIRSDIELFKAMKDI